MIGYVIEQVSAATRKVTYSDTLSSYEHIEKPQGDGLGPLYNAQACVACHQNPVTGAVSQITELRGTSDRGPSLCAGGDSDQRGTRYQERVPGNERVRALRLALNTLGDGYVEAIADATLKELAEQQCAAKSAGKSKVCGQALLVPVLEAPNKTAIGRFGWKDQHASLRSFCADAYLKEMGITTALMPNEFTQEFSCVLPRRHHAM